MNQGLFNFFKNNVKEEYAQMKIFYVVENSFAKLSLNMVLFFIFMPYTLFMFSSYVSNSFSFMFYFLFTFMFYVKYIENQIKAFEYYLLPIKHPLKKFFLNTNKKTIIVYFSFLGLMNFIFLFIYITDINDIFNIQSQFAFNYFSGIGLLSHFLFNYFFKNELKATIKRTLDFI